MKPKCLTLRNESLSCIRYSKQVDQRTTICSFIRYSHVNKSRVFALKLRKIWFSRENKQRMHGCQSFIFTARTLKNFYEQISAATWRDIYLHWFSGSFGTRIMLGFQALWLSLQNWDLFFLFCNPIPELSSLTNHMMEMIYGRLHHLLSRYNHNLLSPETLLPKDPKSANLKVPRIWHEEGLKFQQIFFSVEFISTARESMCCRPCVSPYSMLVPVVRIWPRPIVLTLKYLKHFSKTLGFSF